MHIPHISQILKSIRNLIKPDNYSLATDTIADLTRTRSELLLENAFLRQQLILLSRQVKHPKSKPAERFLLVSLASKLRSWKQSLLVAQPDTLLRWQQGSLPHRLEAKKQEKRETG